MTVHFFMQVNTVKCNLMCKNPVCHQFNMYSEYLTKEDLEWFGDFKMCTR